MFNRGIRFVLFYRVKYCQGMEQINMRKITPVSPLLRIAVVLLMLAFRAGSAPAQSLQLDPMVRGPVLLEQCQRWASENFSETLRSGLLERSRPFSLEQAHTSHLSRIAALSEPQTPHSAISWPGLREQALSVQGWSASWGPTQKFTDRSSRSVMGAADAFPGELPRTSVLQDVYFLRRRVTDVYFGILLADRQLELQSRYEEILGQQLTRARQAQQQGIVSLSDVARLDMERSYQRQKGTELRVNRQAYVEMLSRLTGRTLMPSVRFELPLNVESRGNFRFLSEFRSLKRDKSLGGASWAMSSPSLSWISSLNRSTPNASLSESVSDDVSPVMPGGFSFFPFRSIKEIKASGLVSEREKTRRKSVEQFFGGITPVGTLIRDMRLEYEARNEQAYYQLQGIHERILEGSSLTGRNDTQGQSLQRSF
jgi:hypothetical protein